MDEDMRVRTRSPEKNNHFDMNFRDISEADIDPDVIVRGKFENKHPSYVFGPNSG